MKIVVFLDLLSQNISQLFIIVCYSWYIVKVLLCEDDIVSIKTFKKERKKKFGEQSCPYSLELLLPLSLL